MRTFVVAIVLAFGSANDSWAWPLVYVSTAS